MGEGTTIFGRLLSRFIFHRSEDVHLETEVSDGLVGAHQLNREGVSPLTVLAPKVKTVVKGAVDQANPPGKKVKGIGFFNLDSGDEGPPHVQGVAEHVNHLAAEKLREALEEKEPHAVLQKIQAEIIKKNNW